VTRGRACSTCGGGIWNNSTGTISLSNSTVSNNSVSSIGGEIVNNSTGPFNVKSTIVALNTDAGSGPDVSGTFGSQGFNLIGIDQNNGFSTATDLKRGAASPLDPKLGALHDNGGPTDTRALLTGSPAIDEGISNGLISSLTTDQRGVGYARIVNKAAPNATGGDAADIGAFELGALIKAVSRKTHGTAGMFDINLPLFGPVLGVECRKGGTSGIYKVILTFPTAITAANASVTPDAKAPGAKGSVSGFAVNGHVVTVNLTRVSNAQTIVLTLYRVTMGQTRTTSPSPWAYCLGIPIKLVR